MRRTIWTIALTLGLLLASALPAAAIYGIAWEVADYDVQASTNAAFAVGDMIGNGTIVIVGRYGGNSIQVRDVNTGNLLGQLPAYQALGTSFTMIDVDNDGSMECLVTGDGSTSLLDWFPAANVDDVESSIDFSLTPNPAHSGATVAYTLKSEARVAVTVLDVSGRRVRRLVDERQAVGPQEARWDGLNDDGLRLAPGTYFVELAVDGLRMSTRKSVLLR